MMLAKRIGGIILALFMACLCEPLRAGIAPVLMNPYTTNTPSAANAQVVTVVTPYLNSATNSLDASLRSTITTATNVLDTSLRAALAQTNQNAFTNSVFWPTTAGSSRNAITLRGDVSYGPRITNYLNGSTLVSRTEGTGDVFMFDDLDQFEGGTITRWRMPRTFEVLTPNFYANGQYVTNVTAMTLIPSAYVTNLNVNGLQIIADSFLDFSSGGALIDGNGSAGNTGAFLGNTFGPGSAPVWTFDGYHITNVTAARIIAQTNIDFVTNAATPAWVEGRVFYDPATHTLCYYTDRSAVTVNIGQEQHVRIVNKTGAMITNGNAVTILGAQGNRPKGVLAQATTNASSAGFEIIGMATEDIPINSEGLVTTLGVVNGIDTRSYTDGAALYCSTNAGVLTTNRYSGDVSRIPMGIALNSTVNGSIFVHPQDPIHLDDVPGLISALSYLTNNSGGGGGGSSLNVTNTVTGNWISLTNGSETLGTPGGTKITLDGVNGNVTNSGAMSATNGFWAGGSVKSYLISSGNGGSGLVVNRNDNAYGIEHAFNNGGFLRPMYSGGDPLVSLGDSTHIWTRVWAYSATILGGLTSATVTATNGTIVPQKRLNYVNTGNTNVTLSISTNYSGTYYLVLTNNAYFTQPTNMTSIDAGQLFYVSLKQDSVGARTVSFDTNYWKFPNGQILTTTTNANSWSVMSCIVSPTADSIGVVQTLNFQ